MPKQIPRDEELADKKSVKKRLAEMFRDIEQAYISQHTRSDEIMDQWDIYNCKLTGRQFYDGNSKIFVPIVNNAVNARVTRFANQLFPQAGRYVEVTTSEQDVPSEAMSLAEFYVRQAKLRTKIIPAMIRNGDVEGQYSLYVTWQEIKKRTTRKIKKPIQSDGLSFPDLGETEDMEDEEEICQGPAVEVINDNDILILPVTSDSIEEAIEAGGSVTIMRRWTKAKIRQMKDDGEILPDMADALIETMSAKRPDPQNRDTKKEMASAAGIKTSAGDKYAQVYETWAKVKVGKEHLLCRAYYGGDDQVLGCKQNPYWCGEVPLISAPVEKVTGVFKGKAPVSKVMDMQVLANDACNEGADTAHFSAMPIIMTDPEKNPKVGSMVLGLASIWETSPKDTSFAQFPQLWKDALEQIAYYKNEIFQTLGVNPAMLPQQTGGKNKRNQAEIAMEQQVDLLSTADAVAIIEEGIMTPLIQRFMAYDHQFRDREITIRQFGEMGMKANMQTVPVMQENTKYEYRWFGVEQARNAQQVQQQIAMANVIKGIPPQMYPGYRLNLTPLITRLCDNSFGHRLAPLIFEKIEGVTVDPQMENHLMDQGFDAPVHPDDNDMAHLQVHIQGMNQGDFHGKYRTHILAHQQQMQAKAQAAAAQQGPAGLPGSPGGAGPGVAGSPRPGAQPAGPRLVKGPEGMIPPESMARAGAVNMPRKM